jgi:DNA polymerase-3 subunit alpha
MAGFTWTEVDKLRKAISKKSGKDFDDACELFRSKSLTKGIDEKVVDSVLQLMAKFGGYAFNRSHACAYALLSYFTAWLRYYYPSEWLGACIQIDRLDEDKLAILKRECAMDKITIKEPNINESGLETMINVKGEIILPLSAVKGVGARAEDIINHQPFEDIKDLCYRVRPNRMMVQALAENNALDCLPDINQFEFLEDFMEHWDQLVALRAQEEKQAARLKKLSEKNSLSFDQIVNAKTSDKREEKGNNLSVLLNDNLFD